MRRRILAVSLFVLTGVVVGCSDRSVPTNPSLSPSGARAGANLSANPTVEELIRALFDGPNLGSALSMWDNIQKEKAKGPAGAQKLQSHIDNITKFTLEQLTVGRILDPDGTGPLNPTSGSVKMLSMVFVFAEKFPTELPPLPDGIDAGWSLVSPTATGNQTTVTSFGDAAAVVPPGTFSQTTLVVIVRQPDLPFVDTPFPKLSPTIDVAIAPQVSFESMTILMCPAEGTDHAANARAVIAHQKSATEVEYLDPAQVGNLTCPHDVGAAWRQEKGFLRQRMMQLASYAGKAWQYIGPKPLYAGHAAIGGSVEEFLSPMVAVDPYLATGIVVDPIANQSYGQTVAVSASLSVTEGPAAFVGPVASQPLTASVDGGAPQTATTDANGVANWQFTGLGAGSHTVSFSFAGAHLAENAPLYGASSASASFTVAPATLTVTVNSANRLYGDPNPSFSGSVSGLLSGDLVTASYSTTATINSAAATYPITATLSAAPGVLANYLVNAIPGTLTITPAPLTVQLVGGSVSFGSNPCVVTYSGFKLADNASSLSGTLKCLLNGVPLPQPALAGTYFITPSGLFSTNYAISFIGGTVKVGYNTPSAFLTPLPNSQFNRGRTIPVKFQLFQADGVTPVTTAVATVAMTGVDIPANEARFVYSASSRTYSVNINTPSTVALGAHTITASLDDGSTITVSIIVK